MQIKKYRPVYRQTCIQIFKTNLPKFFANEELQQFEQFLDQIADHYYVIELSGVPVGCGGISFDEMSNQAGLCWGMVDSDYHGQGIGKLLTSFRLDLLKKLYSDKIIKIETSQHTVVFYEKYGFKIVDFLADGFTQRLDRYTMMM